MAQVPQGTPTGSMDYSPGRRAKEAAKRRRQDKRWAAKTGSVTVRKIDIPEPARRDEAVKVFYEPAPRRRRRPTGRTTDSPPAPAVWGGLTSVNGSSGVVALAAAILSRVQIIAWPACGVGHGGVESTAPSGCCSVGSWSWAPSARAEHPPAPSEDMT